MFLMFLYHDFLLYFISILFIAILFVQSFCFRTTCSRLAKTILQLSIQILKITIYFAKKVSVNKANLYKIARNRDEETQGTFSICDLSKNFFDATNN